MKQTLLALLVLIVAAGTGPAPAAAQRIVSPERGSALRAELLDAARPTFEDEVGGDIEFVVRTLNVTGDYAFGDVKLQRPGGQPIDWSRTKFAEDLVAGTFEGDYHFCLLERGANGWQVVEYAIGPTDVAWDWWRQQRKLPQALFEGRE